MNKTLFIILSMYVLLHSGACRNGEENKVEKTQQSVFYYSGFIDENFINTLHNISNPRVLLVLSSDGGWSTTALKAAKLINFMNIDLVIDGNYGICASGCAEYIIPAANSVEFRNFPLIGYHQNPAMIYYLIEQRAKRGAQNCSFMKNEVEQKKVLYAKKGLNSKFWKETLERIKLKQITFDYYPESCPGGNQSFEYDLWFPTSQQLKELLGLEFSGFVCADNLDECGERLDKYLTSGEKYIVGDTEYIVP